MRSQATHTHKKDGRECWWDISHEQWYTEVTESDVASEKLRFIGMSMPCPAPKARGLKTEGDKEEIFADLQPE